MTFLLTSIGGDPHFHGPRAVHSSHGFSPSSRPFQFLPWVSCLGFPALGFLPWVSCLGFPALRASEQVSDWPRYVSYVLSFGFPLMPQPRLIHPRQSCHRGSTALREEAIGCNTTAYPLPSGPTMCLASMTIFGAVLGFYIRPLLPSLA